MHDYLAIKYAIAYINYLNTGQDYPLARALTVGQTSYIRAAIAHGNRGGSALNRGDYYAQHAASIGLIADKKYATTEQLKPETMDAVFGIALLNRVQKGEQ
jgi:hypothetical protein